MSEMTHEQACAACEKDLTQLGHEAARRIMGRCVAEMLEPNQMVALVNEESERLADHLVSGGTSRNDLTIAMDIFKRAVIREGKRIALALGPQGGRA